jgi:hypothetical protein
VNPKFRQLLHASSSKKLTPTSLASGWSSTANAYGCQHEKKAGRPRNKCEMALVFWQLMDDHAGVGWKIS